MMANNQGGGGLITREYRKGNWTVQETMVLIEAKKMDDERRMKRQGDHTTSSNDEAAAGGGGGRNKPAELRWKWVEDYCWRNGCLRSQNQCNDKWDNLMRDFKKVREYESRRLLLLAEKSAAHEEVGGEGGGGGGGLLPSTSSSSTPTTTSYWKMEKSERKDKGLPSNMLPLIYEALVEVLERKSGQRMAVAGGGGGGGSMSNPSMAFVVVGDREGETPTSSNVHVQPSTTTQQLPPLVRHPIIISGPMPSLVPPSLPPPPTILAAHPPPPLPHAQPLPPMCDSSDSDTSEHNSDSSPAKRRRRRRTSAGGGGGGGGEGTSGTAAAAAAGGGGGYYGNPSSSSSLLSLDEALGHAISRSGSVIAEAIQSSEEREERRHRELMSLEERRLKVEESKAEINRQGISSLVDAINKLANSVFALASDHNQANNPK